MFLLSEMACNSKVPDPSNSYQLVWGSVLSIFPRAEHSPSSWRPDRVQIPVQVPPAAGKEEPEVGESDLAGFRHQEDRMVCCLATFL